MHYVNDFIEFYYNTVQVMLNLQRGLIQGAVERLEASIPTLPTTKK